MEGSISAQCHLTSKNNAMTAIAGTVRMRAITEILKSKRFKRNHNDEVWQFRPEAKNLLNSARKDLQSNEFRLEPLRLYLTDSGMISSWNSIDWIVLKSIAEYLKTRLFENESAITKIVYSLAEKTEVLDSEPELRKQGIKACVKHTQELIDKSSAKHVFKSDIASFYQTVDPDILLAKLNKCIADKRIITVISKYLDRLEILDGEMRNSRCLPKGCPLAPVLANFYLLSLDKVLMQSKGVQYVRYMDDFVVVSKTRHHLRDAIKHMYAELKKLKLTLSRPKTWIGRASKGFQFLGYRLVKKKKLTLSRETLKRHYRKIKQLYERKASKKRLLEYCNNFWRWVKAGMQNCLDTQYINHIENLYRSMSSSQL